MIRLTPYLTPEQTRRRRRADLAWRAFMVLALILAAAWLLTPEASATPEADEPGVCEGTPEVLGHEWQPQTRTRDLVPAVDEVSHQVYSYKRQVETFKTEHEFKKQVRTVREKGKKAELVHDWQWWSPASIKWRGEGFTEEGLHGQWTDKGWKYTRTYRYAPTGQTRQVPDGHTWEHSGEVTEPRDAPWVLLPGYPRTEVTTEHVPAHYTPWTDWTDAGDVVRTDEHTEPETPADTDVIEHRWVYVGTYVRTEAVPPAWQDTDPEGECYTGPTPKPTPEPTPDPTPTPKPSPSEPPTETEPTPEAVTPVDPEWTTYESYCHNGEPVGGEVWVEFDDTPGITYVDAEDPEDGPLNGEEVAFTADYTFRVLIVADDGLELDGPSEWTFTITVPEPVECATPEPPPTEDETPTPDVPELPETGLDAGVLGVIAAALVAAGGLAYTIHRRVR